MYKLIIVEDELPVRNRIIESVNWEELGYEVSYAAGDGQDALDYLEDHQMDLILTDIYMPFIDGLELIRRVRETNNYCKVVFLTGYNEFDFAKEAIELDASRYLLKPITKDEITAVLKEIKIELDEEIEAKKNLKHLEKEYEYRLGYLKDKLLFDIISGFMPEDRIRQACDNLKCDLERPFYTIGIIEVVNKEEVGQSVWQDDYSILHFAMYNICKEVLQEATVKVLLGENGKIIVVFTADDSKGFLAKANDLLSEALYTIRHIYDMPLTAGLSSVCQQLGDLKYAYQEACSALSYSVLEGLNRVILKSDIEPKSTMNHQKLNEYIYHIQQCIKLNNTTELTSYLSLYFELIKFEKYGLNEIKTLTLSLLTTVYDGYNQMCLTDELKRSIDFTFVEKIYKLESLTTLEVEMNETFKALSNNLKQSRVDERYHLVLDALEIIENEYSNPSLDLSHISEALHVSVSYFSRTFKQLKEKTFVEYLTSYRMEKAKQLLKASDQKVYEISQQIGYDDAHYFSYNFRKNVGMTPLQYRKS